MKIMITMLSQLTVLKRKVVYDCTKRWAYYLKSKTAKNELSEQTKR
nr:MAG TPA: hypothetical protein [Bacteriophage sp.]